MISRLKLTAPRVQAVRTCKRIPPPYASPTCPPESWSPARMNVPKCKTAKMPCACCEPGCWRLPKRIKTRSWLNYGEFIKKRNGEARSAHMSCIPIKWSRTTGQVMKPAIHRQLWTAISTALLRHISDLSNKQSTVSRNSSSGCLLNPSYAACPADSYRGSLVC